MRRIEVAIATSTSCTGPWASDMGKHGQVEVGPEEDCSRNYIAGQLSPSAAGAPPRPRLLEPAARGSMRLARRTPLAARAPAAALSTAVQCALATHTTSERRTRVDRRPQRRPAVVTDNDVRTFAFAAGREREPLVGRRAPNSSSAGTQLGSR